MRNKKRIRAKIREALNLAISQSYGVTDKSIDRLIDAVEELIIFMIEATVKKESGKGVRKL